MAIDYRSEVDSGNDRKKLVESNIVALLREGIPVEIITQSPKFNYRHLEMVNNLEKNYEKKEEQILEIYGGYSKELTEQIVPDIYSGVSHPVGGELYPIDEQEEKEKFKERDNYIIEINRLKKLELKKLEKEKNKIITNITKYKTKFPVIDRIIEVISRLEEIEEKGNEALDEVQYVELFKENGLNPKELLKYDKIYSDYKELIDYLSEVTIKYEAALNGKIYNEEINDLISKKNLLETEIIQRNTKLVNGFIRQKYGNLLIETDELFQTCYIAMWEAVKKFDYRCGNKFSTLAYKYMDIEVKKNFKNLTGYNWENYWMKKKIKILLENTSALLGHSVTIEELIEYGFLDISEKKAHNYLSIMEGYSFADLCSIKENNYEEEVASQLQTYFGDAEIDDYENGIVESIKIDGDKELFKNILRDEIKNVLSKLTDREKLVLILRYGLNDGRELTVLETAQKFNVTRERIRQIEAKALRKLRNPSNLRKLRDFLEDDNTEENHNIKRN